MQIRYPKIILQRLLFRGLVVFAAHLVLSLPILAQTTPTPTPVPDVSVAFQNNALHDGNDPSSPIVPPLALKWRHDFSAQQVTGISYPLIVQGLVIVTTWSSSGESSYFPKSLVAFDENTGHQVWSVPITGLYGFVNAAYDAGKVFVVNHDGIMRAFDAATGTELWSVKLPDQYAFTSPPTAINGKVFVGGAGLGGTVYAVDENNGQVLWESTVENGDDSSPAVTATSVYVSYVCPQAYAFNPTTGVLQWHYSGPCEGGGGNTPVFHQGKVYVRGVFSSQNGLILNASTGASLGSFSSLTPPAFVGNLALYLSSATLTATNTSTGQVLWSFAGDGLLDSAPVIVNQTIYIGSRSGILYGLDLNGKQKWSTQVGAVIPVPDDGNAVLRTGLGAGDGLLVVPAAPFLAIYAPSGITNISARGLVQTGNNVMIGGFIVSGAQSKNVLVRALGPTLAQFGLRNTLANPTLDLYTSNGALITSNDNWVSAVNKQAIIDSGYAPPNNSESAILTSLAPGGYTAIVRGFNATSGVALVEGYDLDNGVGSKFINLSTRGYVETGANVMIAGVVVRAENQNVLIRALGPTLTRAGVPNVLADPWLELRDSNGNLLQANDNWKDTQQGAIQASGYAPPKDLEPAILSTLSPASYTVILRGNNNGIGNALLEIYAVN